MELLKKHIHRNQVICRSTLQFTVDEDYNVSDVKPDMEEIISVRGEVRVQEQRVKGGKCFVRGVLCCTILYNGEEESQPVQVLETETAFDEVLNMEQEGDEDSVRVNAILEELSAHMIHSRKYGIKGMLRLNLTANRLMDVESAVGSGEMEEVDGLERRLEKKSLWSVAVDRQETYRFRDNLLISGSKPELQTLLCKEAAFRNLEFRPQSDQLLVKGELELFLLYIGENGELTWLCEELPLSATVPVSGLREEMVPHITWKMGTCLVTPQEDNDGEMRVLELEIPLELCILAYEEENCQVLTDIYSVTKQVTPVYRESLLENLLNKNQFRFRESARESLDENAPAMRGICYGGGDVKVDVLTLQEDGLLAEGVVDVYVYYETEEPGKPLHCHRVQIPFSQLIEVRGIQPELARGEGLHGNATEPHVQGYIWEVVPGIDQISALMLDGREMELKVAVRLEALVMEQRKEAFLVDAVEAPFTEEMLGKLPNLVCYFVKPGDDWWSIAKDHLTTMKRIGHYNDCSMEVAPVPGSKLMLVRPQM